jgi:hypothetical protein
MKFVFALFITLLLSSTAFSQAGTVTLSHQTARRVAIDLISYDSTKTALQITTSVLEMSEHKSRMKDSIIKSNEFKENIFRQQITLYKEKEETYQSMVTTLKLDLAKQKAKTKLISGVAGAAIVTSFILILSAR